MQRLGIWSLGLRVRTDLGFEDLGCRLEGLRVEGLVSRV